MKKVALVTFSGLPELTDDDRLLIPSLRQCSVEAVSVVWDAQAIGLSLNKSF